MLHLPSSLKIFLPRAVFIGVNIVPSDSSFKPVSEVSWSCFDFFLPLTHSFNPGYVFSSEFYIFILTPRVTDSKNGGKQEEIQDTKSILSKTFFLGHILLDLMSL